MARYEVLDHTADIGIRAYGGTLPEIFSSAAAGMFSLITESEVSGTGELAIELEADDVEQLLVDWLSELLFAFDSKGLLFSGFEVDIEGRALHARVRGESYDPERHRLEREIKAVTYHMLEVNLEKGYAQVIFDI